MISKNFFLSICLCLGTFYITAQECEPASAGGFLHPNDIQAYIPNRGNLFNTGQEEAFKVPFEEGANSPSTFWNIDLWLGAIHPDGTIQTTISGYDNLINPDMVFLAGPIDGPGEPDPTVCSNWNRVWEVSGQEILQHLEDFADNGIIDAPVDAILAWPGEGNPDFSIIHGFDLPEAEVMAPFTDINGNGIYDPRQGDFPLPPGTSELAIPAHMIWCIFNDQGPASTSYHRLNVEIQLTAWGYDCPSEPIYHQTVFTNHRVISRDTIAKDSFYVGLGAEFAVGCWDDDLMGFDSDWNTCFAYGADEMDGNPNFPCNGSSYTPTYDGPAPVQSYTFLNQKMTYGTYHYGGAIIQPHPAVLPPVGSEEHYFYLTGRWRDGLPLVYGNSGYDPDGGTPVNFAFPDSPQDPDGWSMYTSSPGNDFNRFIGSVGFGSFAPGATIDLTTGWTFHQDPSLNHLEQYDYMLLRVADLQSKFDDGFSDVCDLVLSSKDIQGKMVFEVLPNPTTGQILVDLPEGIPASWLLMDVLGETVQVGKAEGALWEIDMSGLVPGVYFLIVEQGGKAGVEKIIIQE